MYSLVQLCIPALGVIMWAPLQLLSLTNPTGMLCMQACESCMLSTMPHNQCVPACPASPGEEGREDFIAKVRAIFGLREEDGMDLSFGCKVPGSPGTPTL